jgi:hypothetical protein
MTGMTCGFAVSGSIGEFRLSCVALAFVMVFTIGSVRYISVFVGSLRLLLWSVLYESNPSVRIFGEKGSMSGSVGFFVRVNS